MSIFCLLTGCEIEDDEDVVVVEGLVLLDELDEELGGLNGFDIVVER